QTIHWIHDVIPNQLVLQKFERSKTWSYLTSVHFSKDVVLKAYKLGKALQRKNNDELRKIHEEKWLKLWKKGRIEMKGVSDNATRLTKAITSSLYNLLSSLPDFSNENNLFESQWKQKDLMESYLFTGLSPSGLSWGDRKDHKNMQAYRGHLFWDQETWMYPPLLMLHQSSAQLMLQARLRTMYTAGENAKIEGFVGMKYPWESALTGIEVSPDRECGIREIHINGDISLAVLQYLRVTDHNLTCQGNVPKLIIGIADYWLSRSVWNNSCLRFEISCVMPPDEYSRCVNNSAYTNVVARISLKLAFEVAECLKLPNSTVYENTFKRMYVPFDGELNYHPEYDGYVLGKIVKQADVVLLGFPLMYNMLPDVRRRDLEIYENVTSVKGPAMSDAMFTVGWLEVHEPDRARRSFEKMFDHVTGDFQVWTEVKGGHGAPNFITGMGGYLQSIIFGYFGIRIYRDKLLINPELPTDISSMALYGLDYKNCSLDIFVGDRNEMVIKWSGDVGCSRLLIVSPTERLRLSGSRKMTISKSSLYIRVIHERGTNDACFP
ncbi:hypothetical protein HELRODRAFT_76967, partial [Helobdella robusta]|uniref:Protein-glucosylgalactosylhydroxylysine glucosidase n=1 Tax=Helobdella robusta TaxID=6412 RepID=T1G2R9_HELRO